MREAIKSPLETRITAKPPLLLEVQPEEEADPEADHNPQPRENQVKLGRMRVHDFKFRLNEATLRGRSCGVLIDKIAGAIDLSNSWRIPFPGPGSFVEQRRRSITMRSWRAPFRFLRMHWDHEPLAVRRQTESADKSDALPTLCAVRRRPAVAKRLECVR